MPIDFSCVYCRTMMSAPEHMGGKKAKCAKCGMVVEIPGGNVAPPAIADMYAEVRATPVRHDDRGDGGAYQRPSHGTALEPPDASRGGNVLATITASEFGISSTMLGGITLLGQLYPVLGAAAAAGTRGGGTVGASLMLVVILLLSIFAGFLGVVGLIAAIRKCQPGGTFCVVGICVSFLAFITSIMMLSAVSAASRAGGF